MVDSDGYQSMITEYQPTENSHSIEPSLLKVRVFTSKGVYGMQDKSYITIQGWMRTELDLSGNDLLVYAIIYGFSQTSNQYFTGSLQYLADWCGATKQGIMKNLNNLVDRGLINKVKNGANSVAYYTTEFNGHTTEFNTTIKHSLINNIDNTIEDKKENIIINNNTEFFGKIKNTKKKSLYEKCYDHILEFTNNVGLIEALNDYLKMRLQMKDKPLYENSWKGMLNKLSKMDNQLEVVNTSIERGWASFFEQKSYNKKGKEVFGEDEHIASEKGEFISSGENF